MHRVNPLHMKGTSSEQRRMREGAKSHLRVSSPPWAPGSQRTSLPWSFRMSVSSVQSLSHVRLFVTPWTAARQTSLSITNSRSLLKFMSIELVVPSNHLILCCPLLLLPSIFLGCVSQYILLPDLGGFKFTFFHLPPWSLLPSDGLDILSGAANTDAKASEILSSPWGWSSPPRSTLVLIFVWILVPRWLVSSSSLSLISCWPWFCSLRMSSCQEVHCLPGKLIPENFIPGILQMGPDLAEFQMRWFRLKMGILVERGHKGRVMAIRGEWRWLLCMGIQIMLHGGSDFCNKFEGKRGSYI